MSPPAAKETWPKTGLKDEAEKPASTVLLLLWYFYIDTHAST